MEKCKVILLQQILASCFSCTYSYKATSENKEKLALKERSDLKLRCSEVCSAGRGNSAAVDVCRELGESSDSQPGLIHVIKENQ